MQLQLTRYVYASYRKRLRHFWMEAPEELLHLRQPHWHKFFFALYIEVFDNDREIACEYVHKVLKELVDALPETSPWSCEEMVYRIAQGINRYPKMRARRYTIEASETRPDQGAIIEGCTQVGD